MPQLVYVTNIQKFCTHDGPGIRTNVFFKGCSMECKWCANPETIDPYPQLMYYRNKCTGCGRCIPDCIHEAIKFHHDGSRVEQIPGKCKNCGACVSTCRQDAREIIGELKTPEEVFEIVNQDKVFYQQSGGGVTFSGGEPFLHPEFIQKVSAMCKAEGYNTAVETCGNFCLSPVLKIIDLIDHVLFDIKIIDEEKHIRYCGKSNQKIHRNFETLLKLTDVTPRVPISMILLWTSRCCVVFSRSTRTRSSASIFCRTIIWASVNTKRWTSPTLSMMCIRRQTST